MPQAAPFLRRTTLCLLVALTLAGCAGKKPSTDGPPDAAASTDAPASRSAVPVAAIVLGVVVLVAVAALVSRSAENNVALMPPA